MIVARSKEDAGYVDEGEEVLPVLDLVLGAVQALSLPVAKYFDEAALHRFFLALSRFQPVEDSSIAPEPHPGFDYHPHNLRVNIQFVGFRKLGLQNFLESSGVGFQFVGQGFSFLPLFLALSRLELKLPHRDFHLLPDHVDELSHWSSILFLFRHLLFLMGLILFLVV